MAPRFGIIGNFRPDNLTHVATNTALDQAGLCAIDWLATDHSMTTGGSPAWCAAQAARIVVSRGHSTEFAMREKTPWL